jgi:hypothetical protein
MQGDLPCPCAPTMNQGHKYPLGDTISNVVTPFRVRKEAQAKACGYSSGSDERAHLTCQQSISRYNLNDNINIQQYGCPTPRMGGRKGEAGERPALSRNCNPPSRRARTTAQIATTTAFAERGWSDDLEPPCQAGRGFV